MADNRVVKGADDLMEKDRNSFILVIYFRTSSILKMCSISQLSYLFGDLKLH